MTEQQFSRITATDSSAEPAADVWRSEVQSRLARYKTRRGRRIEGAFSMRFLFPADETVEPLKEAETACPFADAIPEKDRVPEGSADCSQAVNDSQTTVTAPMPAEESVSGTQQGAQSDPLVLEPAPEPEPEPYLDTVPRPRPKRKVIAFPRHLSIAPEAIHRLADPVTAESPRILDVPEELEAIPTTPFLDGLQLDPFGPADASRDREHVELPCRAVGVSQRVFGGVIDAAVTGVGVAIFAGVAFKILSRPPITKPLILGLVAASGLFWSVYQYLFTVYAGKTLGMMSANVRLRNFSGKVPNLRQRRHRVVGFYLSVLSLGMGLMWVFVDVDSLCWHDRLSQTYLADR